MPNTKYLHTIRDLIGRGQIDRAMEQLRVLLENSPHLDVIIQQQARFQAIRQQIRLGTVSHQDATLTKNQISAALLDLLQEIEEQGENPAIGAELNKAISIINSKNVNTGEVKAGRDVRFGDHIETHYHQYAGRKIPHALTPPPFRTEVFVGREADLQNIHDRLFSPDGNLLLLVNGEGGIGKTTLAARYFFDY
ncbi:MAG: hypothetical protein JNK77_12350 [Saprospiraceae bacterium]|nr:hypothetical protein [Saprospiraceae bacterium]